MRMHILVAAIAAVVLANLLVFGAISTYVLPPTPRPSRVVQNKTYTPNPFYAQRMVTPTLIPSPTPTRPPTAFPQSDPRVPFGKPVE